ncbi:MAG: NTP transferase domain-containing protein, partial [Nanoarchaeota archaeon]|nr:NTP transferase domain-containing protein [Nanoarchaeota archaeon]
MKKRVTLTIENNILDQVDKEVDGHKIKNRSHAVELYLLKALGVSVPKQALILAGGEGTRLRPLTHEIPKPLIPLQSKPLLEYSLDLFKKFGIKDIYISIGFKGDKIKEHFGDGSKFGVKITYIEEDEPLGTAGPLRLAKRYIKGSFIVCNADELKDIDLVDMFLFHKDNNASATIALTSVDDTSKYGVAKITGNKILDFVEKPKKEDAPSKFINSGLYIFEPEIIDYIPEGSAMLEKDVFPKLAREGKLFGYPFAGYWKPIGTME